MLITDSPKAPRTSSLFRLIPVTASFALIVAGNAKAEEPPYVNQDIGVEQRYDPAQKPKLHLEHKMQKQVQYEDKQKYAELGVSEQQQHALDTSEQNSSGGPGGPGGPEKKKG